MYIQFDDHETRADFFGTERVQSPRAFQLPCGVGSSTTTEAEITGNRIEERKTSNSHQSIARWCCIGKEPNVNLVANIPGYSR